MMEKGKYEKIGYRLYQFYPNWHKKYHGRALASVSQMSMLMGLITNWRFTDGAPVRRVLEVGVNSGVSSLYMLKAGTAARTDFTLYGIDLATYKEFDFFGHACRAESTKEELSHWKPFFGKTTLDIEEILPADEKLDMIFIDAAHAHPYPVLDFIFLFPFVREDALLVFHDVDARSGYGEMGACYVYDAWPFPKYRNWNVDNAQSKPTHREWMGILEMPPKDGLAEMEKALLLIAKQEIDAAFYDSQWTGGTDKCIRPFMRSHYAPDFADAFCDTLLRAWAEYQDAWPCRKNAMQFGRMMNNKVDQCIEMQKDMRRLFDSVNRVLPRGSRRRKFLKWLLQKF